MSAKAVISLPLMRREQPGQGLGPEQQEQEGALPSEQPGLRQGENRSNPLLPSVITSHFVDRGLIMRARQGGTFPLLVLSSAILKRLQIEYRVPSPASRSRHTSSRPAFRLGTQ